MDIEELKQSVSAQILEEVKKTFVIFNTRIDDLNKKISTISETLDVWKSDLDVDRESLQNLNIGLAHARAEIEEVRSTVNVLPKKVSDKVSQTVSDDISEAVPRAVKRTFNITKNKINITKRWWFLGR